MSKSEIPMDSDRGASRARLISLALAAVLACGFTQNLARVAARIVIGRPLDHGVHAWWMTPLGDAVVYTVVVLLLIAGSRASWARRDSVQLGALLFPIMFSALLLGPNLHPVARLALAMGLAARFGSWLARFDVWRYASTAWRTLAVTTVLIALPIAVWPPLRAALDVRQLRPATPGAPNVLVLLWDTARASSLNLYGNERPTTPFLTAFAGGGVVFDRAYGTASYTLPSHASLFTGRWAHELSSDWAVPLDRATPTLAEVFRSSGYRTGSFSANRIYVTREWGLGRGFIQFEEHRLGLQQIARSSTLLRAVVTSELVRNLVWFNDDLARVRARDNHRALVHWLQRDPGRPYFAFVNFMEAHTPYLPSPPFAARFGWYQADATQQERRRVELVSRYDPEHQPPGQALHALRAYEASLAELDAAVHSMLEDLRARGLLDNTLVVVTADHGEEFGEHGVFAHGNSLYVESIRVPLVLVFPPKVPPGIRVRQSASIRDVGATILDLVGVTGLFSGSSLRPLWEDSLWGDRGAVLAELRHHPLLPTSSQASFGDVSSAIDDSLQVILRSGAVEVFDLMKNPAGVAAADSQSSRFALLASVLAATRRASNGRIP